MMKVVSIFLMIMLSLSLSNQTNAQFWKFKKKKAAKTEEVKKKTAKKTDYDKLVKGAEVKKGMFNTILKEGKVYLEIPKNLFGKKFLISSRVTKVSDNEHVQAGRLPKRPTLVSFNADTSKLFIIRPNFWSQCDKNSDIYDSYKRNNIDPIWKSLKIKTLNNDSTAVVADFTALFYSSDYEFNPFFEPRSMFEALFPFKGSLDKKRSRINTTKAFSDNVQIKQTLSYTVREYPFTIEMTRNIIRLKDEPARRRLCDNRYGYFTQNLHVFDYKGAEKKKYLQSWKLIPKDKEAYKRGELVEPVNPIVWYVDSAIPAQWRQYIIDGIEDWKVAFEEIGFKNAITAREYPTKEEDPNFDPDDIKYNCYRYITTDVKNSMGPSWVDPRSGEILGADVLFYSNVVKLLQDWRFIQTAAVDERVRTSKMDDKLIGESLRYVAAHEVGHTLGLMHNFIASTTFPVDSLRSAKFTQKYGTTPSIMDYARYNYVAQPGDKGLRLTPPDMGIYDKFQIKLAYTYLPENLSSEEVKKITDKWLFEKKNDLRYTYVNPYIQKGYNNVANNTESVGDDPIKASQLGIKNLKYIENNLVNWLVNDGDDYEMLGNTHYGIANQFYRYMLHVFPMIGGEYRTPIYEGYDMPFQKYVSRKKQKDAVNFIFKQLRDFPQWWDNKEVEARIGKRTSSSDIQIKLFKVFFSKAICFALTNHECTNVKNTYTFTEYHNDLFKNIWSKSQRGKVLDIADRGFQSMYVEALTGSFDRTYKPYQRIIGINLTDDENALYTDLVSATVDGVDFPAITNMGYKTLNLLRRLKSTGNVKDRAHYKSLYIRLNRAINKK